jgi:exopolysaccharide production protein ExoZ
MGNFRSIQLLRFVAAVFVVISHSDYIYMAYARVPDRSTAYAFGFGAVGVHIFFVISGFVMYSATFGAGRPISWKSFLFRRFVRIYPIYWLYAALFLALMYGRGDSIRFDLIAKSLLLIPGYSSLIIGQGWTLSYELYFYVCFAACIWLGMVRSLAALSVIFIALIAMRKLLPTSIGAIDIISNPLLLEFVLGALIATAIISGFRVPTVASVSLIVVAVVAYTVGLWFGYQRLPSLIVWGIPSAILVLGVSTLELDGSLSSAILDIAWLGDSSYSLYLLHPILLFPILAPIAMFTQTAPLERILICLAASIIACLISIFAYSKIEKPLTNSLQSRKKAVAVQSAGATA